MISNFKCRGTNLRFDGGDISIQVSLLDARTRVANFLAGRV
jgi:hypothetical protein